MHNSPRPFGAFKTSSNIPKGRGSRAGLGLKAERIASQYLESKGYRIIQQNFRCRLGEIDIIAKDRDFICFIEIRSKSSPIAGLPQDSVTLTKRDKITRVALAYLKLKRLIDANIRFDVVSILFGSRYPDISLIKGAFEVDSHWTY